MTHPFRLLPVLASLSLVALAGDAAAPRFTPKEGTTVRRTLEMSGKRELQSLVMQIGDETHPATGAEMHVELSWKQVTKDELGPCTDGRVQKLTRSYESLERRRKERSPGKDGEERVVENDETCDLEGKSVVFKWNADKDQYECKFAGDEKGDDELLADLEADMDYRALLPEKDAAPGAKWKLDLADVKGCFLRPGGDLPFHGEKPAREMDLRMRKAVWESTKGEVELELGEAREEDGHHLSVIRFHGKELADASTDADGDEPGPSRLELTGEESIEGELTWDLDAGRAKGISWNAKGNLVLKVSIPVKKKDSDETATLVQAFTFDTDYDYTGSFEVE